MMTKKDFIELAKQCSININCGYVKKKYIYNYLDNVCSFCYSQNSNFDEQRFIKYVEERIWKNK